jgi:hypothetical protein
MATQDKQPPVTRPDKDTSVRDNTGSRKSTEEEDEGEARHAGGVDDIPDGDGPRSDRGTNPLPDCYWDDFPGGKP